MFPFNGLSFGVAFFEVYYFPWHFPACIVAFSLVMLKQAFFVVGCIAFVKGSVLQGLQYVNKKGHDQKRESVCAFPFRGLDLA